MLVQALLGGALIGLAGAMLLFSSGRILGVSGITSAFVTLLIKRKWKTQMDLSNLIWRGFFLLGLFAGGAFVLLQIHGEYAPTPSPSSHLTLIFSGLLVGVGTRMGLGCTSGHGVCGVSRFSLKSLFATILFISAGMMTVFLAKQWRGF